MNRPAPAPEPALGLAGLFRKDPLGFLRRAFVKVCVGPFRYGRGHRYDASRFWADRFSKYGTSLQGSGDEAFSEAENRAMYDKAGAAFLELCRREGIDLRGKRVLDIGCGTGFYTALLQDAGVASYTGLDLTDVLFAQHRERFPGYRFLVADATTDPLPGTFDVIVMLDVIQNIVTREKFDGAMRNVRGSLSRDGVFVVAPVMPATKKHLFYMHFWSRPDLERNFPGHRIGESIPFRHDGILAIRPS